MVTNRMLLGQVVVIALFVFFFLACGPVDNTNSKPEPALADVSDFAGITYTEVKLPNGEVVPCLYMGDGVGNGGLSCGWDYGNGRFTSP